MATGSTSSAPTVSSSPAITVSDMRLFGDPRQQWFSNLQINVEHLPRTQARRPSMPSSAFAGAVINANIVDGAANGISIVNFRRRRPHGRPAPAISIRNLSTKGPYPADAPGFGNGISRRGRHDRHRQCDREARRVQASRIGWGEVSCATLIANANVVRQAGVGIAVSVVEGCRRGGHHRQSDRPGKVRRNCRLPLGRNAATDDLAKSPGTTGRNLTVERNHVS
jgi:hypothetical protein